MWPPVPRSTSRRANDRQPLTTPPRLMSSTRSYSSAGVSRKRPAWPTPALFTTMSGTPCSAQTRSANRSTASASETSSGVGVRDPAARGDLGGGVLDAGLVDVADHQFGALTGEGERGLATDTAARAGHGNQCVAEVFALDDRPVRVAAPGWRLAVQKVDEFGHRPRQHLRVRHRRPVAGLDVAAPQPRHPVVGVVVDIRPHERVLGVDDQLHRNVDVVVGPGETHRCGSSWRR